MDVLKIIDHYYGEGDSKLKSLLLNHSHRYHRVSRAKHLLSRLGRLHLSWNHRFTHVTVVWCRQSLRTGLRTPHRSRTDSEGHCLSRITSSCHIINARDDRRKSNLLCRQVLLKNTPWRGEDVGTCRTIAITLWQRRS